MSSWLQQSLSRHRLWLNLWAMTAAFSAYFFMYMFRKPFTAASFSAEGQSYWDDKAVIVSAQVIGYFLSKLIGIRVVSQMPPQRRAWALVGLIGAAQVALLLFAVLPSPWHVLAIFLNGLPLGMVFGLVLGFLEGRRLTEALVAGLCASFIVAGGVAKSIGQWTLNFLTESMSLSLSAAERWMPFVAGALFLLPFVVSTWMLSQVPPPDQADTEHRSERSAMTAVERRKMLLRYGWGLGAISLFYLLITILRSLRDDFAPQILLGMGATIQPSDYAWMDTQVAAFIMVVLGMTSLVRDNRWALQLSLGISMAGFALTAAALVWTSLLSPLGFMVMIGAGLYLPYVAVHTTVFERLIALTRDRGNIGFLMYVVDSIGYLAYVVVLLLPKQVLLAGESPEVAFYQNFRWYCWSATGLSVVAAMVAFVYFSYGLRQPQPVGTQRPPDNVLN